MIRAWSVRISPDFSTGSKAVPSWLSISGNWISPSVGSVESAYINCVWWTEGMADFYIYYSLYTHCVFKVLFTPMTSPHLHVWPPMLCFLTPMRAKGGSALHMTLLLCDAGATSELLITLSLPCFCLSGCLWPTLLFKGQVRVCSPRQMSKWIPWWLFTMEYASHTLRYDTFDHLPAVAWRYVESLN